MRKGRSDEVSEAANETPSSLKSAGLVRNKVANFLQISQHSAVYPECFSTLIKGSDIDKCSVVKPEKIWQDCPIITLST